MTSMNATLSGASYDYGDLFEAISRIEQYVCIYLDGQIFGIPVHEVQDVLDYQRIAPVPLAPPEIAGSLNLRGRIVTAIDLRRRLDIAGRAAAKPMSVVIEREGELFSLLVDRVGEVVGLSSAKLEPNPPTLARKWREISHGVHRLQDALLIIINVSRLLDFSVEADLP